MADKNNIEEIFRSALEHHELSVRPEVWAGVQASLAQTAVVGTSSAVAGSSVLGKAAAIIGMAALITGATVNEVNYQTSMTDDGVATQHLSDDQHESVAPDNTVHADEVAVADEEIEGFKANTETDEAFDNHTKTVIESTKETENTTMAISESEKVSDLSQYEKAGESPEAQSGSVEEPSTDKSMVATSENRNEGGKTSKSQNNPLEESSEKPEATKPSNENATVVSENTEDDPEPAKTTAYFTHDAEQMITPNGDPFNEYFEVDGFGVGSFHVRIMTQAGKVVFESSDINFRWNGVDRFGNKVPAGVYFYEIQAVGTDSLPYLEKNAKGNITIVR